MIFTSRTAHNKTNPYPRLTLTLLPQLKSITTNQPTEHVIISVQDRSNRHPARPNCSV